MRGLNRFLARFEQWLDRVAHVFFTFWDRHKVGILGTIALNLVVAILFFALELRSRPYLHETFMLIDFEREYELYPEPEPEDQTEILPKDAIDPHYEWEAIRNIAVDATRDDLNPGLTDEKAIDADELYSEAQRIREEMQRNREQWEESKGVDEVDIPNVEDKSITPQDEGQYKGPTVISYYLEGRTARYLPVPAYKCRGGGRVVVDIEVQRDGAVGRATIDAANSVIDDCMNTAAIEAARASRFSIMTNAPNRQTGSITYLFVAQ